MARAGAAALSFSSPAPSGRPLPLLRESQEHPRRTRQRGMASPGFTIPFPRFFDDDDDDDDDDDVRENNNNNVTASITASGVPRTPLPRTSNRRASPDPFQRRGRRIVMTSPEIRSFPRLNFVNNYGGDDDNDDDNVDDDTTLSG
jgi:hypothetical protein